MDFIPQHPMRQLLADEIHARPVPDIAGSASIIHLAMTSDRNSTRAARKHFRGFLEQLGASNFSESDSCDYRHFGEIELRWETHQEFCSYMLILPQDNDRFFPELVLPDWWAELIRTAPGHLINGIRLELRCGPTPENPLSELPSHFGEDWVYGSHIVERLASVWSSLRQDDMGLTRYLVFSHALSSFQAGRTCQRLIESDTYRMVALLGFPLAREVWPLINTADSELGELTSRITEGGETHGDQKALAHLGALSTRIERLRARTGFRFSASRAYAELSRRRLSDLRESRWEGTSSLAKLTDRRFLPAMQTCDAADRHLRELSERISQTTSLLRTRVELNQEMQNQKLLDEISQRAKLQLRLQSVVEGFSVIAITYYLVGMFSIALGDTAYLPEWLIVPGFKASGIVALALVVYWYVRKRKKRLLENELEG